MANLPASIKECFDIILSGNAHKSRTAARAVRKLVYSNAGDSRGKFVEIAKIIDNAASEYAKISEETRQENFVMAISVIYFLHNREAQPDFLFPWLFQLLQHDNGYIRHSAVKMLCNELGPLTVHIRCPCSRSVNEKLSPEKADRILFSLFMSLNELNYFLWRPKYKKYKYINSLPPSPYKSTQQVLWEIEEDCGKKYIDHMTELASLAKKVQKEIFSPLA